MPSFKVARLTIEGFRAFTHPQTLDVQGKHLFVFGRNGRGKSSIIEAIRWCIWGGDQEGLVRNSFYEGDCRVTIEFDGPGGSWRLTRRMLTGVRRSDPTLIDPDGNERGLTEAFGQLPRISGEGTYVVLAQQQARGRPSVDITAFDDVLYAYLGLLEYRDLSGRLSGLLDEYRTQRDELASRGEEVQKLKRSSLSTAERELDTLVNRAPWGESDPPTADQTKNRLREQALAFGVIEDTEILAEEQLLSKIQEGVESTPNAPGGGADLEQSKEELSDLESKAHSIRAVEAEIEQANTAVAEKASQLTLLESEAGGIDALRAMPASLVREADLADQRTHLVWSAHSFLKSTDTSKCPICLSDTPRLLNRLRRRAVRASRAANDLHQSVQVAESAVADGEQLIRALEAGHERLMRMDKTRSTLMAEIGELMGQDTPSVSRSAIDFVIAERRRGIAKAEDQAEDFARQRQDRKDAVQRLEDELEYQRLRLRTGHLREWLDSGMAEFQGRFEILTDMIDAVEDIRSALNKAVRSVLVTRVPSLEVLMTEVYQRLTEQQSFDVVRLEVDDTDGWPSLQVAVAPADDPTRTFDYEQVLNGQSLTALRLVLYFVFARARDTDQFPLELLMLDDPTQRFDLDHVGYLFEELQQVAGTAQLIVCTHQREIFLPLVKKTFRDDQRVTVDITDFTRNGGPVLVPG